MMTKKTVILLALAAAIAAIGLAGTALAQTPDSAKPDKARSGYAQQFLDRVATALGVERSELGKAMDTAKDQTLDKMVEDGKLSRERADRLKEKDGLAPWGFGFRGGALGPKDRMPGLAIAKGEMLDAVAGALNMSTNDLRKELQSGKSLGELVQGKEEAVKTALLAKMKARLDTAVANGRITQARADKSYKSFQDSKLLDRMWMRPGLDERSFKKGAQPEQRPTERGIVRRGQSL